MNSILSLMTYCTEYQVNYGQIAQLWIYGNILSFLFERKEPFPFYILVFYNGSLRKLLFLYQNKNGRERSDDQRAKTEILLTKGRRGAFVQSERQMRTKGEKDEDVGWSIVSEEVSE